MRRGLFWAAAFLTALLHAGDLMAAIASKRDGVRPEMTWNPRPEQDDILLPMPCGLKMALRAVARSGRTWSRGVAACGLWPGRLST